MVVCAIIKIVVDKAKSCASDRMKWLGGDGVVKAAFLVEIGSEDRQRPKLPQALEVGVLLHVIWDDSESSKAIKDSRPILNMCGMIHNPVKLADYV